MTKRSMRAVLGAMAATGSMIALVGHQWPIAIVLTLLATVWVALAVFGRPYPW